MEYYAGLDVSMEETHICVVDREGVVAYQAKATSIPDDIAKALTKAPECTRVVFETGRMAPMLYHGLIERGVPVVCIESRQAYQALRSLATHKTDRNDARGLAHAFEKSFGGSIVSADPIDPLAASYEPYIAFFRRSAPDLVFVAADSFG